MADLEREKRAMVESDFMLDRQREREGILLTCINS